MELTFELRTEEEETSHRDIWRTGGQQHKEQKHSPVQRQREAGIAGARCTAWGREAGWRGLKGHGETCQEGRTLLYTF